MNDRGEAPRTPEPERFNLKRAIIDAITPRRILSPTKTENLMGEVFKKVDEAFSEEAGEPELEARANSQILEQISGVTNYEVRKKHYSGTALRFLAPPMRPNIPWERSPQSLIDACTLKDPEVLPSPENIKGIELQVYKEAVIYKNGPVELTDTERENFLTYRIDMTGDTPVGYRLIKDEEGDGSYQQVEQDEWVVYIKAISSAIRTVPASPDQLKDRLASNVAFKISKELFDKRPKESRVEEESDESNVGANELWLDWLNDVTEKISVSDDIKALFMDLGTGLFQWHYYQSKHGLEAERISNRVYESVHEMLEELFNAGYEEDANWLIDVFFSMTDTIGYREIWDEQYRRNFSQSKTTSLN